MVYTIYIGCAGGATSSLIAQKISVFANEQGIQTEIEAFFAITHQHQLAKFKQDGVELLLLYGAIQALDSPTLVTYQSVLSGILVAPQVRYYVPQLQSIAQPFGIPVVEMDMLTFGRMDGARMFDTITAVVGNNFRS
ncbi:MAG: PTS sugar transporter subunit IIB [Bacilli bacterium]